jgi:hypothetical protein
LILFVSLVRSKLEYVSPIWSPEYKVHINAIERIQNNFLRFINYKLKIPKSELDYNQLRAFLNIEKLSDRRILYDLTLLFKLTKNCFNVTDLTQLIHYHVPAQNLRSVDVFHCENKFTANYLKNTVVPRIHRLSNEYLHSIDIFDCSYEALRSHVISSFARAE